jgi:hypothetical protein
MGMIKSLPSTLQMMRVVNETWGLSIGMRPGCKVTLIHGSPNFFCLGNAAACIRCDDQISALTDFQDIQVGFLNQTRAKLHHTDHANPHVVKGLGHEPSAFRSHVNCRTHRRALYTMRSYQRAQGGISGQDYLVTCLLQALAEINVGLHITPRTNCRYYDFHSGLSSIQRPIADLPAFQSDPAGCDT